jgi:two-component system, cell cycle response regulator
MNPQEGENMPRKYKPAISSGFSILIADDDLDYLQTARTLLEREGHKVLVVDNGPDVLEIMQNEPIDLLLVDYFMPQMNGEEVVSRLREYNTIVQVILQTGYASEKPPREMLKRLDIQGYHNKADGPENLLLWTEIGLKSVYTAQLLNKSRLSLQQLLKVPQDIKSGKPLTELLQGILWQICGLFGIVDSFLAVKYASPDHKIEIDKKSDLKIYACSGRFERQTLINIDSDKKIFQTIMSNTRNDEIFTTQNETIAPLCIGELIVGAIYLDKQVLAKQDQVLLIRFAKKAAIAIQNSMVYDRILKRIKT